MSSNFVIRVDKNPEIFADTKFKNAAQTYSIDFSPWAEEYGTITTVTWTSKAGQAGISGQTLSNNVASALLTFSQEGSNLIEIKATNGTEAYVAYLDVLAKDPSTSVNDYE